MREDRIFNYELPETEEALFELQQFPIFDYAAVVKNIGLQSDIKDLLELSITKIFPEELVKLKAAYDDKNWEKIRELSHKLKGGSLYSGTIRMTVACQYIERYYKAGHRKLLEKLYHQLVAVIEETDKKMREVIESLD